jgi:hypothetical protein
MWILPSFSDEVVCPLRRDFEGPASFCPEWFFRLSENQIQTKIKI